MISITLGKFLTAASAKVPGELSPLASFFALRKPVAVAWANRKMQEEMTVELASYREAVKRIAEEHKDDVSAGQAALDALLEQEVHFTGAPVKIGDLRGDLSEEDIAALGPFLAE